MARPRFKPTMEQRSMVKSMSGVGIPEDDIARFIGPKGIAPKTLRKHFRRELSLGITLANTKVLNNLFRMASSGDKPAPAIFWAKTRVGFREQRTPPVIQAQTGENANVDNLDQTIMAELARLEAAERAAALLEPPKTGREATAEVPVERVDGPAKPAGPSG